MTCPFVTHTRCLTSASVPGRGDPLPLLVALLNHASSRKPPWIPPSSPLPPLSKRQSCTAYAVETNQTLSSCVQVNYTSMVLMCRHKCTPVHACTHKQSTPPLAPLPASDAVIPLSWHHGCEDTSLWDDNQVTLVLPNVPA